MQLLKDTSANTQMLGAFMYIVVLIPTVIVTIYAVGPMFHVNELLNEKAQTSTGPYEYDAITHENQARSMWYVYLIFLVVISVIYFFVLSIKRERYGGVTQRRY